MNEIDKVLHLLLQMEEISIGDYLVCVFKEIMRHLLLRSFQQQGVVRKFQFQERTNENVTWHCALSPTRRKESKPKVFLASTTPKVVGSVINTS